MLSRRAALSGLAAASLPFRALAQSIYFHRRGSDSGSLPEPRSVAHDKAEEVRKT